MYCLSFSLQSKKSQNQGNICRFYSTPQGCRHGDNCRFVHPQSSVSMSVNSHPTLSGRFSVNLFFVSILSKHTCCCFVTVNLTAWHSTFKVQIEHYSARGFINNSSTRATGFHREVKLFTLNFCIAICPEPSFPRKTCLDKHNCFQG